MGNEVRWSSFEGFQDVSSKPCLLQVPSACKGTSAKNSIQMIQAYLLRLVQLKWMFMNLRQWSCWFLQLLISLDTHTSALALWAKDGCNSVLEGRFALAAAASCDSRFGLLISQYFRLA